jgi:UDP-glucose 4-epimerase
MSATRPRAVVTGGAGFIGSHLVDALAETHDVLVVDDFSTGRQENLLQHRDNPHVRVEEADVCDADTMHRLLSGADAVYHLATQCVRLSIHDAELVHHVNATGALRVCEAAAHNRVGRLIYVSSSEAYGSARQVPMGETHPCEPTTVYGASKLAGEHYAKAFGRIHALPVVVVRPFNTFGPRSHIGGVYGEVIPRFLVRALNRVPQVIFGNGEQTRDFTYVSDTVRGILLAARSDALLGESVNIGNGEEVSILTLARLVQDAAETPFLPPELAPERPGDVRRHHADIALARSTLGYEPRTGIEEGLRQYVAWFRQAVPDHAKFSEEAGRSNWESRRLP